MQINISKNLTPFAIVIAALVVAGAVIFSGIYNKNEKKSATDQGTEQVVAGEPELPAEVPQYDTATLKKFAECLTSKGMKFYGASWCSWCKKEKDSFGDAKGSLPYIECVDPQDQQKLTPECEKAGIQSFPTWQLPNGTKEAGFKTIDQLAATSGCEIGR
ncbi:MAG: hypothetical protein AAB620_00900 [Patescibacteria group bacterium]